MTTEVDVADTDAQLMLAYQSGNVQAFNQLYETYRGPVFRFILRHGFTQAETEELYQELWSRVIKARQNYQASAKFNTWLYQIARNLIADHFRAQQRQLKLVDDCPEAQPDSNQNCLDDNTMGERLKQHIQSLPDVQREALLLHFEAGMTLADIAEVTASGIETVKSRIRYGVNKLKQMFGGADHDSLR